jgi:hypothetical protein
LKQRIEAEDFPSTFDPLGEDAKGFENNGVEAKQFESCES